MHKDQFFLKKVILKDFAKQLIFVLIIYVLIIPISRLAGHVVFQLSSEFGVHLAELTVDREGALAIRQVILKFIGLYVCLLRSGDSCDKLVSLKIQHSQQLPQGSSERGM